MKELEKLLNIKLNPGTQGKDFIRIRCFCEFEGHGVASETWEKHWILELPMQQAYWKTTKGWAQCQEGITQKFHAKTFDEVVARAIKFLKERRNYEITQTKETS